MELAESLLLHNNHDMLPPVFQVNLVDGSHPSRNYQAMQFALGQPRMQCSLKQLPRYHQQPSQTDQLFQGGAEAQCLSECLLVGPILRVSL